jgi:hypothetical protein
MKYVAELAIGDGPERHLVTENPLLSTPKPAPHCISSEHFGQVLAKE